MHRLGVRLRLHAFSSGLHKLGFSTLQEQKVALVTGSSRGIGRAIALQLARHGCKVVVTYASNSQAAKDVINTINSFHQTEESKAVAIQSDCSDPDEVKVLFAQILETIGPVDILVNNAGINRDKLAAKMSPGDFSDVVNLNLNGTFYCSQQAFLTSMMKKRSGRIINISSIVGQIGNPGQANYAASKGGVLGLTRSLAKEFAVRNVCVNAVCPGYIDTGMTDKMDSEKIIPQIPLKRLGTPEEVSSLVAFLALDPAGAYITGHCFNIDGGLAIGAT
mmetsp:Transcript_22633/g.33088  ORF Transcript_22633/g.33088 Transcript_22633/m.33088 type:complete len:277 (-) Transcript_22633:108-938(-)